MVARRSRLRLAMITLALLVPPAVYPALVLHDLPTPASFGVTGSITLLDRNSRVIAVVNPGNARQQFPESLAQMGKWGPAATLAAEDRGFNTQGPIDTGALARSAVSDVVHHNAALGASTISEQLVKIDLGDTDRTLGAKAKEAYLAWVLERRYSKDQILEMYLNTVFYGHNSYGLEAAARTFFGVHAAQLDVAEAAMLAGLLQAPTGDDPALNWPAAQARERYVLDGLVTMKQLSPADETAALAENLQAKLSLQTVQVDNAAPHFTAHVVAEIEQLLGAQAVQEGGLIVHTTLDLSMQGAAQKAVDDGVSSLNRDDVNNGALLAADTKSGAILAWVGSADFNNAGIGGQFDVVTSPRQPGSSFKPYVYEAALRDHVITLCTNENDSPTSFNGYAPTDWDGSWMGNIPARQALLYSRNVPTVAIGQQEGIAKVDALAQSMGVSTPLQQYPSTAIGTSPVTLEDQVQGYQTFADSGHKVPLIDITSITDGDGKSLYAQQPGAQAGQADVLTPAQAWLMTSTLSDYQNIWHLGWQRQMAGKSGTTGAPSIGGNPDAWMMAYNPSIVIGAWAGNTGADGSGGVTHAFGTGVGSSTLAEFINGLPASAGGWYQQPAGITTVNGIPFLDGTKPDASCAPPPPEPGHGGEGHGHGGGGNGGGDGG